MYDKLKELGLEKFVYYGLNLRTVLSLLKLGLIDIDKVRTPDFKTQELWEKGGIAPDGTVIAPIKDRFKLDSAAE